MSFLLRKWPNPLICLLYFVSMLCSCSTANFKVAFRERAWMLLWLLLCAQLWSLILWYLLKQEYIRFTATKTGLISLGNSCSFYQQQSFHVQDLGLKWKPKNDLTFRQSACHSLNGVYDVFGKYRRKVKDTGRSYIISSLSWKLAISFGIHFTS